MDWGTRREGEGEGEGEKERKGGRTDRHLWEQIQGSCVLRETFPWLGPEPGSAM